MRYANPDVAGKLGANFMHLERREKANYRVGNPGAHGRYRVALRGFCFGQPVKAPPDTLYCFVSLKLPESVIGYPQRFQLAGAKEIADACFVKNVWGEFDAHSALVLSVFWILTFYKNEKDL